MNQCYSIIVDMIPNLVIELMKAHNIVAQYYKIDQYDAHIFSVKENENWPEYVEQPNRKNVFAFSCKGDQKEGLYIFKEYGMGNRIPGTLLETIKSENGIKLHCYVSLVEENAYSEVINHNNDVNDPTRGTGIYSLKQFFDFFFGKEEYIRFKKYADEFTQKVSDYFGFEIVRTLKLNTLHNFRRVLRDNLRLFDINELDTESRLSKEQRVILNKNFLGLRNFELLTGSSDFAQSYMTAEWLYTSLTKAGNIDLTPIAMGYFKAIEQLLFSYISLHTREKDGRKRSIHVGKAGNLDLTDAVVKDENITKEINLGSLTGFFGFHKTETRQYWQRNKDLLVNGINDDTYQYIVDVFSEIVGLRNGYFHKHNLSEWGKVEEARNSAHLVFYLLFGAYKINDNDKKLLGLIMTDEHDGFYKLCEYLNNINIKDGGLSIPIFYMDGQTDPTDFWIPHKDDLVEYDIYGEPKYSGAYLRRFWEKQYLLKLSKEDMPNEIWEGSFNISRSVPIKLTPSGPKCMIYKDGVFVKGDSI